MRRLLTAFAALLCIVANASADNLVQNGDFELAINPPMIEAPNFTDWVVWEEIDGVAGENIVVGGPPVGWVEGNNFGDIVNVPDAGDPGTIVANIAAGCALAQDITTEMGTSYTITYDIGGLGGSAVPDYTADVEISVNGVVLDTQIIVQTAGSPGFFGMKSMTATFVADSTTTTLMFENTFDETVDDFGPVIDNVCVEAGATVLKGDVNLDGVVDLLDVQPFVDRITSGPFQPEADVNCDGFVDLLDVAPFVAILTGG